MRLPVSRLPAGIAAILLLASLVSARPAPAQPPQPGLFGTREVFSPNLAPFEKWDNMLARAAADKATAHLPCRPDGSGCAAARWRALVAELKALPLGERIERVNEELNQIPYVSAERNWHDAAHWETPLEFLARGGQCQDYAIAKYMALAASGVPERDLRIVVVRDRVKLLDHAIAVVYVDGAPLVLDNQIAAVTPAARIERYRPYYSINRTGWWYHESDQPTARIFAQR